MATNECFGVAAGSVCCLESAAVVVAAKCAAPLATAFAKTMFILVIVRLLFFTFVAAS